MKKSSFFVAEHILMNLIHKNKKKDIYISNIRNNLTRSDNPRQDWDKIGTRLGQDFDPDHGKTQQHHSLWQNKQRS